MIRKSIVALPICIALAASVAEADAPPICFDFDGSLPVGTTLTRATPRTDATGALIATNTPRFTTDAIAPAPQLISELYDTDRVVSVGVVSGQVYTALIRNNIEVRLVIGTPVCDDEGTALTPDAAVNARFGYVAAEWGVPRTVQVLPDGTVLVHTFDAGPQRRCLTLRTTLATFESPVGWTLVRTSDYAPPPNNEPAFPHSTFTRITELPNLGLTVSTIAEYTSLGLVSSVDPLDGRSLGYASTDSGLTWTRIIDTDDPNLGRTLVEGAKHMHHLEPFEWFDTNALQWRIGAVGCLGDAEGEAGQIWVRSPFSSFPTEGLNGLMTLSRTRIVGRRALTDIFPIDNSQAAGEPLRFIQGQDGELSGIIEARVENGLEENIAHFSPTVPNIPGSVAGVVELPQYPYIFQMDRLTSGCVVAGTTEAWTPANPNGLWQSDPTSEHWTTIRLADTRGYNGLIATTDNRFWAVAILGEVRPFSYISQLWQAGVATARAPVMLGAGAHDAVEFPIFDAVIPPGSLTVATGAVPPPPELPAATPIDRLTINAMAENTLFSTATIPITGAAPGDQVHIVFWIRPAPIQAGCQAMQFPYRYTTQAAATVVGPRLLVDHETNLWTRVAITETVPPEGMASFTIDSQVYSGDATPQKPIDFYLTRPIAFVSAQPVRQHVPLGGVAEDRLTAALPALGADWTIGILATEAMTFAVSAVDGSGDSVSILPGVGPGSTRWSGIDSTFELRSSVQGAPTTHGSTTAQDVFVPTQSLVFLRRDATADTLELWCSRGMGELDTVAAPGLALTPTELRFGAPDWSTVFEGNVHRIKVWPDRALSEEDMRRERLTLPLTCIDAPAIDVSEPIHICPPLPPKPCKADINMDGFTNAADFIILAGHYGQTVPFNTNGDLNLDGIVNAADFVILAGNFGCVFAGN